MFLAIAVDNLANAQELTAAEEGKAEEDKEKQLLELKKEMEALQGETVKIGENSAMAAIEQEEKPKTPEEEVEEAGPKPMLPYSCMFILSPTNPYAYIHTSTFHLFVTICHWLMTLESTNTFSFIFCVAIL